MAEKIISPGVFTNEIDQTFLPAAVADIGAALVGPTLKGPAGIPTVVTSFSDFQAKFGDVFQSGSDSVQFLTSHAAEEYLKNSNTLTVVRVMADGTQGVGPATADVTSQAITAGATFASGSVTLGAELPSGSAHQLSVNGIDFIGVTSSSLFNDSATSEI